MNSRSVSVSPAYTRQTTLQCLADMDWPTVISTAVGVIAGGLVNAFFSWQGSKELRREAGNLRLLTKKLMLMMHDAELIKVEWDENGNPIRVVELSGTISGSSSMTARPGVVHQHEQDDNSERT
jgi:hypothetical protein